MSILLQAANTTSGMGNYSGILMIVAMIAVFYFLLIRPQQKRQKEIQRQRDSLKSGDRVVLTGGIYGIIKEMKDSAVIVEIAENVKVKVDKNSVFPSAEDAQVALQK